MKQTATNSLLTSPGIRILAAGEAASNSLLRKYSDRFKRELSWICQEYVIP